MVESILYLVFFAGLGIVLFLAFQPRLTGEEKVKVFVAAAVLGPVMAVIANHVLATFHDAGFSSQGDIRDDDGALHMLAAFLGLAASAAVLWWAQYVSKTRTYEEFVGMQQRLAQARAQAAYDAQLRVEQRQERMLQGQVQLARLQVQDRLMAIHQDATRAEAIAKGTALAQAEQKLRLRYSSYCSTVDPLNDQEQPRLVDGFRGELNRPRFSMSRAELELLNQSDDPLVRQVLHGRPTISLTPDDWVTP